MEAKRLEIGPVVHIIDDDASIRDALEDLFLSVERQTRTYAAARDFLEQADPDAPGCLLSDVRLPKLGGLELHGRLAAHGFSLPVVFMSGFADIAMAVSGLKTGALDFLLKPLRNQDVLDATDKAIEVDSQRRSQAAQIGSVRTRLATLTGRERQVVSLVLAGMKNREVADALSLREITVKNHRGSAMHKLGARTVQELVRLDRLLDFAISETLHHLEPQEN